MVFKCAKDWSRLHVAFELCYVAVGMKTDRVQVHSIRQMVMLPIMPIMISFPFLRDSWKHTCLMQRHPSSIVFRANACELMVMIHAAIKQ